MARLSEHSAPHLTRRGSLAYYLAAWVCGTFFFVAAKAFSGGLSGGRGLGGARGLFFRYFFALATGWAATLLFAFLLRRAARILRWRSVGAWLLCGAVLAILFGIAATWLPGAWIGGSAWPQFLKQLFELKGENGVPLSAGTSLSVLLLLLAGAATAFVLFRVENAFAQREDASK